MRKTSDLIWQDAQHQVLFDILDEIGQPGADVSVLHKLQQYMDSHFALEEEYMRQLAYPGYESHLQAHDKFREEIDQLLAPGQAHDEAFYALISTYLTEWLKRHVFRIDKDLEEFILSSPAK